MNRCCLLFFALSLATVFAEIPVESIDKILNESWEGNARVELSVTPASGAPVIDGRIDEQEWQKGVKLAGFNRSSKGLLPEQRGFVYLMFTSEHLYLGVRTTTPNNDPGGGLVANASEHDSAVYNDDSVELILHPIETNREAAYHIIINSKGVVFDRKHSYTANHSDVNWNIANMQVATRAESNWWDLEVKIPLSEIDGPAKSWAMNVARNWSNGIGSTALIPTGSHLDQKRLLYVSLSQSGPSFRMNGLGAPEEGEWNVQLSADNPTNRTFLLAASLRKFSWPTVDGKPKVKIETEQQEIQRILPGESGTLNLDFSTTDHYIRKLSVALIDAETGRVLCRRSISAQREVFAGNHPATGTFELGKIGSGLCWYYPSYNRAALRVNIKSELRPTSVTATFGDQLISLPWNKNHYRGLVPLPAQAGQYPLTITITDKEGKTLDFRNLLTLTRKVYPWENNQLGRERIILPPFTPIKAKGNQVELMLRSHRVNAQGVWDSLIAENVELLAAPMHWRVSIDGKPQQLNGKPPRFKVPADGCDASSESFVATEAGVDIRFQTKFDYDGFFWSEVQINKIKGKTIDHMTLVIPLKDEEVSLYHVVANTIRSNPGGAVPSGEGELWNGTKLRRPSASIHPQLVPYIWLGGVKRGLSWFTDSSFGYCLAKERSALRLLRKDGILYLEIDIINRSVELKDGHTFAFGMQATPVKTLAAESRRTCYDNSGVGVKGMKNIQSLYYGLLGYASGWAKAPVGDDYGMMRVLTQVSKSGEVFDVEKELEAFSKRYDETILSEISALPKSKDVDQAEHYKTVRRNFIKLNWQHPERGKSRPVKYSDPRLVYIPDEIVQYFKSEWWINNVGYFGAWRSYPVTSNLDYMIYAYNREMENGLHGIYLDDMFLMPNENTDTVARVDDEGEVHSEIGILALRELVKRLAVLQHQHQLYPRHLEVHMTNAQLVPCFSFATAQLTWESKFGETPHPERFELDEILAEGLGIRLGLESLALGGILRQTTAWKDWPALRAKLSRACLALSLPHDVKVKNRLSPDDIDWKQILPVYEKLSLFGHWMADCSFVPYWEKDPALKCSDAKVLISSYRRPGKILVIASNLGNNTNFSIQLDHAALGVPDNAAIINLENGETVDPALLKAAKYDFLLLQIGETISLASHRRSH